MSTNTNPLTVLRTTIWTHVAATDAVVDALRAAGETDEVKALVLRTYMARRMFPGAATCTDAMLKKAQAVLALPGASAKEAKKRTPEQERFYNAARQYLFALRNKAGVAASDKRGGANNTGSRAPRTPDGTGDIPIAPAAAPKAEYETENDVRAHVFHVANTLTLFLEKHRGITGDRTRAVVARFFKDVSAWAPKPDAK